MSKNGILEHVARAICDTCDFSYNHFIDAGSYKETYKITVGTKDYALKIFKSINQNERTEREIDAMRRASCRNVVTLLKVDNVAYENNTFLYLVEEYLAGGSLSSLLENGNLSKSEMLSLGRDLICSLEAMHRERIVHRDIKPDNILYRSKGAEAVLTDFGLVRDLEASSITQTFHMRGPGTPFYSSPEQLNNEKALIDWRTDQFALGITLCIAMLGVHPFDAGSPANTVENIAARNRCNDSVFSELINMELEPLAKMLEPYPIRRYRTPSLLKNDWYKLEV